MLSVIKFTFNFLCLTPMFLNQLLQKKWGRVILSKDAADILPQQYVSLHIHLYF